MNDKTAPNKAYINTLKALYRDGFPEDSEAFCDYFVNKYAHCAVTAEREGEIVSVGYVARKSVSYFGKRITVPYIIGISTLTKWRGQKIIGEVIAEIIKRQSSQDKFIFLSPFNATYYHKYGFFDIAHCVTAKVSGGHDFKVLNALNNIPLLIELLTNAYAKYDIKLDFDKGSILDELQGFIRDNSKLVILCDDSPFAVCELNDFSDVFCATTDYNKLLSANILAGKNIKIPSRDGFPINQAYSLHAASSSDIEALKNSSVYIESIY